MSVGKGEFVPVVGPNGAGKSTLLNILTGVVSFDEGRVLLGGWDIMRAATHKRVRGGLGRTFQHVRPFERMSVLENVMTGAAIQSGRSELELRERAMAVLDQMGLVADAQAPIGSLSYGHRRMVETCRALACEPTCCCLTNRPLG
ncbi:ATP-binding cassette domain-containing protein [Bradyrhizobium sp. CCBAU 11434]|uniref:ATP-binding cassette domain-containing protein n=1 Tax=Bradyrhizobium sp. CCBAU 11434 TaxID=1630885 RepID=UPI0023062372|nr:ATP-binding cassette domain-containing protein [Bradyrhizobium sp. CCBAU 11434]